MILAGLPDAAPERKTAEGRRRWGYMFDLASSTLQSPCHVPKRTPTFTRKLVMRNKGGEAYAFSEMMDH